MRVCLICEGSYPYVSGGVSSWVQMLCTAFSDVEFAIWSIATTREEMHEYKYQMPSNIVEVRTLYLGDQDFGKTYKPIKLTLPQQEALRELVCNHEKIKAWQQIFDLLHKYQNRLVDLLMGEDFYQLCVEVYEEQECLECFKEFLWTFRGMYFPLMKLLASEPVEADLYHTLSTGYAGVLGSFASAIRNKPLVLSEHGIYTREREEDIIRAEWVKGNFKELWINFFKKASNITYEQANVVTTLFGVNKELQIELGCPKEKILTIPNGVEVAEYEHLPSLGKIPRDKFNFGTILRIVPIKDVKTMLLAFQIVREREENVRLTIMGNFDESPEYYEECVRLIRDLDIPDVVFTGQVNVRQYVADVDALILSSISEGQPFAILEGMAAGKPFVSTNVGACKELLEGTCEDQLGKAGIVVPLMDSEAMANALLYLVKHPEEAKKMGQVGQKRVKTYYQKDAFLQKYHDLYEKLGGGAWQE